jgi:fucose 4-O-acetylase-like acetyltransferase
MLSQFFFMGLFFLVSGYFMPGSVDRKGGWRYLKDRLVRLGIPLVLYSTLISPFVEWVKGIQEGYFTGNLWQFFVSYWRDGDFAPGPLWFLEILLVFSALFLIGWAVRQRVPAKAAKAWNEAGQRALTHLHILVFILILAPVNFIVRLLSPIGEEWNHIQLAFYPVCLMLQPGSWLPA